MKWPISLLRRLILAPAILAVGSCSFENSTHSAYNIFPRTGRMAADDVLFVVGVEKFDRAKVGYSPENDEEKFRPASQETHAIGKKEIEQLNSEIRGFFYKSDDKVMTITHIVGCDENRRISFPYDLRRLQEGGSDERWGSAFRDGESAANSWADSDLRQAIQRAKREGRPFTHVFVMCMGWVNDQEESVLRYRSIAESAKKAAREKGDKKFRPLVVGITWPSGWMTNSDSKIVRKIGHFFSYPNKADDADEVGMRVICPLVFQQIAPSIPDDVRLVCIGHSFGARAMTRAIYSRPLLAKQTPEQVDLLISLQGAVSLRRWLPKESGEGTPYLIKNPPPHYLTASEHDNANPHARWSVHIGSQKALERARENPSQFEVTTWRKATLTMEPPVKPGSKPVVIDAKEIVTAEGSDLYHHRNRDGHNNTLDLDMGRCIYYMLQQIE